MTERPTAELAKAREKIRVLLKGRPVDGAGDAIALILAELDAVTEERDEARTAIRAARKMLREIEFGSEVLPLLSGRGYTLRDHWLTLPAVRTALEVTGE